MHIKHEQRMPTSCTGYEELLVMREFERKSAIDEVMNVLTARVDSELHNPNDMHINA